LGGKINGGEWRSDGRRTEGVWGGRERGVQISREGVQGYLSGLDVATKKQSGVGCLGVGVEKKRGLRKPAASADALGDCVKGKSEQDSGKGGGKAQDFSRSSEGCRSAAVDY